MRVDKESNNSIGNVEKEKGLTERQEAYVSAYRRLGSARQVATEMSVSIKTAQEQLLSAAKKLGYENAKGLATESTPRTVRNIDKKASAEALVKLIEAQEYRCQLSGVLLKPSTASLDHKVPVSSGGSDELENLQWVSTEVNRAKGSMSQESFIAMCKRVASWNS